MEQLISFYGLENGNLKDVYFIRKCQNEYKIILEYHLN